jgi:pimeloyl-ACP methyl ester carboxylesterase
MGTAAIPMLRQGAGEPLVLLHGITGSARMWADVVPLLADRHDVVAPTALGHRGGRPAERRPARIAHVADDIERLLDELGFDRPHLAGNSMGGWVALELARRGRARSVCALSPAGCWLDEGDGDQGHASGTLRRVIAMTRLGRPTLPITSRIPLVRRFALADTAAHGERVSPAMLLGLADDLLGCTVHDDLLSTDERLAPLDPVPCPITIAWAERDRILPLRSDGANARKLVPGAEFKVLPGVGHVPMLDDPKLVAETILAVTGAA